MQKKGLIARIIEKRSKQLEKKVNVPRKAIVKQSIVNQDLSLKMKNSLASNQGSDSNTNKPTSFGNFDINHDYPMEE